MAERDPELKERWERGEALLAAGDYAAGYRLCDAAWRQRYPDKWFDLPLPRWRGEPVSGERFLIVGEQGVGDQIQFARFARLLQARGAAISWLCRPPLVRLLQSGLGFQAFTADDGVTLDDVTYYCPSGELPLLFFPPLTQPPSEAYIAPPAAVLTPGRSIGVATKGNAANYTDRFRSLPPHLADELRAIPGAMSLHPEDTGAADFYDTAALIAGLDLVITVDTAVAHLAGSMGKPVWILLSSEWTDPRWLRERVDTPWYPTARLFRQPTPGDWRGVIDAVKSAL